MMKKKRDTTQQHTLFLCSSWITSNLNDSANHERAINNETRISFCVSTAEVQMAINIISWSSVHKQRRETESGGITRVTERTNNWIPFRIVEYLGSAASPTHKGIKALCPFMRKDHNKHTEDASCS